MVTDEMSTYIEEPAGSRVTPASIKVLALAPFTSFSKYRLALNSIHHASHVSTNIRCPAGPYTDYSTPSEYIFTVIISLNINTTFRNLLHTDIEIKSLSHPHADLPVDMQIFTQLIVEKKMILQTVPLNTEPGQNSWKLRPECIM
jgi:hypothetical protein